MNTRPIIENLTRTAALSASFNQDASYFAVGLESGFGIFTAETCELKVCRELHGGIGAIEMLEKTNFIALVGGGKQPKFPQNKVVIWDDAKQKIVIQIPVNSTVHSVRITRSHIALALRNSIRVYEFKTSPDLWAVFETTDNPLGLCCLTSKTLAFPGRTIGQVQLVELASKNVSIIPAHGTTLRALELSRNGEILATASETGTLIRVFARSNCARIAEFRRGVDHAAIYSLAISPEGNFLAVTSDKSTLHIFDIPHLSSILQTEQHRGRQTESTGKAVSVSETHESNTNQKWGILGKLPLLPRVFSDVYSFTSARFSTGEGQESPYSDLKSMNSPTDSYSRPAKGIIGWLSDNTLILIGAGTDGRWEKFVIAEGEDGRRHCIEEGWKKFLSLI